LRLAIGAGMFAHGYAKLAHGPAHFAEVVAALGMPVPLATAWLVIAIELASGAAILLGAFVRPAALAAMPVIATAIVGVHLRYGFLSVRLVELTPAGAKFGPVGYELGLVYLGALVALAASEPTPWSIDRRWRARPRSRGAHVR
jgi:putative oxidoreductase